MPEVKFRYWDPFNEQMVYSEKMGLGKFFNQYEWLVKGTNKPVLMQFTGLKDQNAKDIYSRDIVDNQIWKFVVKFGAYYDTDDEFESYGYYLDCIGGTFTISGEDSAVEIIGNDCQNPELLEKN